MWCASLLVLAMAGAAELGAAELNDDLSLWVAGQGRCFEPTNKNAPRIDLVQARPGGDYAISDDSPLMHEVARVRISEKQVKSLMGIERNDIWLHAAHALEGTRCAAMQSGIGSANTSTLQRGGQCVEPLFF